jgi:uncharacterized protein YutE (UPF0331/DUF86 family)
MVDDLLLDKAAAVERAVGRARELYASDHTLGNQTRLDAIVLSLQRACECCINAAMHMVRVHRLGVPQETREAFDLVERAGLIDADVAEGMRVLVAFRNQLVHDHESLTIDDVQRILANHLDDFGRFTRLLLRQALPDHGAAPADSHQKRNR